MWKSLLILSNPPLEEDDLPNGEWVCHRCIALGHRYEVNIIKLLACYIFRLFIIQNCFSLDSLMMMLCRHVAPLVTLALRLAVLELNVALVHPHLHLINKWELETTFLFVWYAKDTPYPRLHFSSLHDYNGFVYFRIWIYWHMKLPLKILYLSTIKMGHCLCWLRLLA